MTSVYTCGYLHVSLAERPSIVFFRNTLGILCKLKLECERWAKGVSTQGDFRSNQKVKGKSWGNDTDVKGTSVWGGWGQLLHCWKGQVRWGLKCISGFYRHENSKWLCSYLKLSVGVRGWAVNRKGRSGYCWKITPYKSVAVKGVGIEKLLTFGSVSRGVCLCVCVSIDVIDILIYLLIY